jgi:thiamine-phosphate pyrophosphorylase
MTRAVPRLLVITDTTLQTRYGHADLARYAIDGGADGIQLRDKEAPIRELLAEAEATRDVCARAGVAFYVNDRVDVALAVGAHGVHVGQDDMPVTTARRLLGPEPVVGVTAFTPALARAAAADGADYVGFGPIFGTQSKANARPATGVDGLASFATACDLPVIAVGSVRADHVTDLLAAGAHGVAVISAVCCAPDVAAAARAFARRLP